MVCIMIVNIAHGATYKVTDLGTLGGHSSRATAINEAGQVVGYSWVSGNTTQQAYLYSNGSIIKKYKQMIKIEHCRKPDNRCIVPTK